MALQDRKFTISEGGERKTLAQWIYQYAEGQIAVLDVAALQLRVYPWNAALPAVKAQLTVSQLLDHGKARWTLFDPSNYLDGQFAPLVTASVPRIPQESMIYTMAKTLTTFIGAERDERVIAWDSTSVFPQADETLTLTPLPPRVPHPYIPHPRPPKPPRLPFE